MGDREAVEWEPIEGAGAAGVPVAGVEDNRHAWDCIQSTTPAEAGVSMGQSSKPRNSKAAPTSRAADDPDQRHSITHRRDGPSADHAGSAWRHDEEVGGPECPTDRYPRFQFGIEEVAVKATVG